MASSACGMESNQVDRVDVSLNETVEARVHPKTSICHPKRELLLHEVGIPVIWVLSSTLAWLSNS